MDYKCSSTITAGVAVDQIKRTEHRADRTAYKYMNLAYLSPKIINDILEGEVLAHVNLQTLFGIAEKYADFDKQESAFYKTMCLD